MQVHLDRAVAGQKLLDLLLNQRRIYYGAVLSDHEEIVVISQSQYGHNDLAVSVGISVIVVLGERVLSALDNDGLQITPVGIILDLFLLALGTGVLGYDMLHHLILGFGTKKEELINTQTTAITTTVLNSKSKIIID